jgi:sulfur carrier protein
MPIVIKLNGKETELAEGTTVGELLDSRKIRREMVTVQVNGVIIDRNQFDTTPLKDGDEVEFLYYMGGGTAKFVEFMRRSGVSRESNGADRTDKPQGGEQNDGVKPFGGLADGAGR